MSSQKGGDLLRQLADAREYLDQLADQFLTLESEDGWVSQIRFPFVRVGTPGVYNITPDQGQLGVEIRAIPQDNIVNLYDTFRQYARRKNLRIGDLIIEAGSAIEERNPYLRHLMAAVEELSGSQPDTRGKLAGTSARFAPGGNGIVWGQTGIGPHSNEERHYIPSIMPYFHALDQFANRLMER
jgi:acetylornithine deacetylase/succinyl-diaminopimelate desuccinylase-like protein